MNPRKRILFLILIMFSIVVCVEVLTIRLLYNTAIEEEKLRLEETVHSQASLIEAVARFDKVHINDYPHGTRQATLEQIRDAHSNYIGFSQTGEFTLSTKENDNIVFLLNHRHYDLDNPKPVPWNSKLAEPMRLALSGKSGTIIGLDYRGEVVVAAYTPVVELGLGIVAKIDLSEIREPFIEAGTISGLIAVLLITIGVSFFIKISNPLIAGLFDTVEKLKKALEEVKALRGILPICSYCKKIRDDNGYWNQIESYVSNHSEAMFSHGLCPDCARKLYPDLGVDFGPMLENKAGEG